VSLALTDGVLRGGMPMFDYGCGHGSDVRLLSALRYEARGWAPAFAPQSPRTEADVVKIGFVVNVIEHGPERADALQAAGRLARRSRGRGTLWVRGPLLPRASAS
jgi:DNA phosphorothioation-associated putative methyltransferase